MSGSACLRASPTKKESSVIRWTWTGTTLSGEQQDRDPTRRGVAQPGSAPGSGPGGRRFKSSRPDHSFQGVISDSWSFIYTTVDKIVDGHILRIQHVCAEAGWC